MDLECTICFLEDFTIDLISSEWNLLFNLAIEWISGKKSTHILSIINDKLL